MSEVNPSTARMRRMRVRNARRGLAELRLWVNQDQLELMDKMAKSMGVDRSAVARFLIFKTMRQLTHKAMKNE